MTTACVEAARKRTGAPEAEIEVTPEMIEAGAAVLIDGDLAPDLGSTRKLVGLLLRRALERVVLQSAE
jgi:hypothetical protein